MTRPDGVMLLITIIKASCAHQERVIRHVYKNVVLLLSDSARCIWCCLWLCMYTRVHIDIVKEVMTTFFAYKQRVRAHSKLMLLATLHDFVHHLYSATTQ